MSKFKKGDPWTIECAKKGVIERTHPVAKLKRKISEERALRLLKLQSKLPKT